MGSFKERIAEVLVSQRVATKEQMDDVAGEAKESGVNFARLLIDRGIISEAKLTEMLSKELSLPMISLAKYRMDPTVARLVPERLARQYNVIPLTKFGERLVVAMSDPMDICAIEDLKAFTQIPIDPVLSPETEIRRAIEQAYSGRMAIETMIEKPASGDDEETLDTAVALLLDARNESEAPVVRVINLMVLEALRHRASDIHLEPMETALRVRYRVDGRLAEMHRLPKAVQSAVVTRLKLMAGVDITESRLPQDGRFKIRVEEREIDFRVSVLPITHGGKIVLRLLDKGNLSVGLDHLGFLPESIERFKEAVKRPYGMILVTGPTGSGKSTTLYSVLSKLNQPEKHLVTIEDPVEYQIEGITQMQVYAEIGLTFANGLRAILRQAPDVVMIGEIRDAETADIAMKASLTGHLVLSTLHTNDAPSAVSRLIDMGVEPFLVASSINLIQAQRLVRTLCLKCRKAVQPSKALLEDLGLTQDGATFFEPGGCHLCKQTGYRGRTGIIEVFQFDERIRDLVVSRVESWEIKEYAIRTLGMHTLREDGLQKAALGMTTLEEVLAVTGHE